jgi:rhamnogalacturonyl hydrolase YesR
MGFVSDAKMIPQLSLLLKHIEQEQYRGYDPYDALNSSFLRRASLKRKYLRILFIQAVKRSPVNLRPLLGIRKDYNPKGIGLLLWGYSKLYKLQRINQYLEKVEHLLTILKSMKSKEYSGNSWGYNFDWQSRAFYVPKYTPTVVNSSFVGHALLDAYEYTGIREALDLAIPIKDFISNDLNRHEEGGMSCFSYTPLDHYFVHNANLLGASLLIRLYSLIGGEALKSLALSSLAYSMRRQREDGSWPYAEREGAQWIDSFHTGFNLQGIKCFLDRGHAEEYRPQFDKGVKFYKEHFFLEDGTPKYFHDRIYPIDIHCSTQAVVFFSQMGPGYHGLAEKVLNWLIHNMQDPKGYFYFQKTRYYTNRIAYIRWSQAWAFHALTQYCLDNNSNG